MSCDYCGFSSFGKHKCLSCGAPNKVQPAPNPFGQQLHAQAQLQMQMMQTQCQIDFMMARQQMQNSFSQARMFG